MDLLLLGALSKVLHLTLLQGSPVRLNNSKGMTIMKESGAGMIGYVSRTVDQLKNTEIRWFSRYWA
jgi:hypothetical protein